MTLFNLKKMKKEELWKLVDMETQWLAYQVFGKAIKAEYNDGSFKNL